MTIRRAYILVFWGKDFDEAAATLFVTILRQAGLRVKVVGVDGQNSGGANGLALVPDLTLSQAQALTAPIRSVVLPCDSNHWVQLFDDPRVEEFIQHAQRLGTQVVVQGQQHLADNQNVQTKRPLYNSPPCNLPMSMDFAVGYPKQEELIPFIRSLAAEFASQRTISESTPGSAQPAAVPAE